MEKDFLEIVASLPEIYEWKLGMYEGKDGVFVKNIHFETVTHFTWDAIKNNDVNLLINATHQGKNVEQITRVTGFFSKVSAWNKGKRAELKDRHRSGIGDVEA